jgi:hypothetical protein
LSCRPYWAGRRAGAVEGVAGDGAANPLEVLYSVIDEDTLKVFHAMKCRNIYIPLIKRKE